MAEEGATCMELGAMEGCAEDMVGAMVVAVERVLFVGLAFEEMEDFIVDPERLGS